MNKRADDVDWLRGDLLEHQVPWGDSTFSLFGPADPMALYHDGDEELPYWADLWPSARAMGYWLAGSSGRGLVEGRAVLELGCGLGLGAIACLRSGANHVTATDYEAGALAFCQRNLDRAGADCRARVEHLDWRAPEGERFERIIGADVLYDRANVPWIVELLQARLAPRGVFLLADPQRPTATAFFACLANRGLRATPVATLAVCGDMVELADDFMHQAEASSALGARQQQRSGAKPAWVDLHRVEWV